MFKQLMKSLVGKNSPDKDFKIQTFTFFIPAPPPRQSGYREKQFDKLFYEFINRGYEILHFSTETCTGENNSGMWVIFVLKATNAEAEKLLLNEDLMTELKSKATIKDEIEGLYYIDDKAQEL